LTTKNNKYLIIIGTVILLVIAFFLLRELKSILIPFFIAIVITFIFHPFYRFLKSKRVPGWVAIVIILLIIVVIANIASVFIFTSVNSFAADFPKYEIKFRAFSLSMFKSLKLTDTDIRSINESLQLKNMLLEGSVTSTITSIFSSVLSVFGDFVLILIYVVFLLSELGSIKQRIGMAFTPEKAKKLDETLIEIFTDVKKYIVGKTLVNLIQGFLLGLILWAFGVDYYFIWGFLCFLSRYIPNIGSLISTILPAIIAFLQFDNIITPIIIVVLLVVVDNVIGNVLEPKFLGDQLDLSPLLLLLSLLFWGYVWGIVGMILSVPIMSMIKITLSKFESTRPAAILMSYKKSPAEKEGNIINKKIKNIFKKPK
jgi:AI-2 transport protein TqsA